MTVKLGGIHDREGRHLVPAGGWCLDTIALAENAAATNYTALGPALNWIVRANWGYGSTGTIPLPAQYEEMARRLARYVEQSAGCTRWIIGNEPNLPREWPNGQPILPLHYAECYLGCRDAIHALPGHEHDEVLVAGPGPWNADLKYAGNREGDWIAYFEDVQEILGVECDGFALHAYARGYDPAAVTSEARMGGEFEHRRAGFRVYRDFVEAIAPELRHLPRYLTEVNGNGPWVAQGHIPAVLSEISEYNAQNEFGFSAVIFYRYPDYDTDIKFHMAGKADVIAEFQAATEREYVLPRRGGATDALVHQQYMPQIASGPTAVTHPTPPAQIERDPSRAGITEAFKRRVPTITLVEPQHGTYYYRLLHAEYVPDGARRFGPDHHILVDVLDETGKREMGTPVNFYWADGMEIALVHKTTEPYGVDYAMTSAGHGFGVWVGNFRQNSDDVFGMGLGTIEQPDWAHHVSYYLVFQKTAVAKDTLTPQLQPVPEPQSPTKVPALVHPVADQRYRVVTQVFGVNADYYKRFSVDGVPLKGHNGIDFGTPIGSNIVAVDVGRVVEVADDSDSYGRYIKMVHQWGESLYAHLSEAWWNVGNVVAKGDVIGRSGNTGNSSGPHLHFGLRVKPYNRRDGWGGYSDPLPYLPNPGAPAQPLPRQTPDHLLALIKAAAQEFGLGWQLLASLAWAESSWNPGATSKAGAIGTLQIMPTTWQEWAPKVGASNPLDARDNLRVGAAYFAYLLKTLGNEWSALCAYNFGIGNVLNRVPPPDETIEFANKVLHGRDLLMVVGS